MRVKYCEKDVSNDLNFFSKLFDFSPELDDTLDQNKTELKSIQKDLFDNLLKMKIEFNHIDLGGLFSFLKKPNNYLARH